MTMHRGADATITEFTDDEPTPKLWKSLGHALDGLEAHYSLQAFRDELDVDLEAELRHEARMAARFLVGKDYPIDGAHFHRAPTKGIGAVAFRFVACNCGEGAYLAKN